MKILYLANIPAPYMTDFFNELGKYCDLTVIFEATGGDDVRFNYDNAYSHFKVIFLRSGNINEKHIDKSIYKYLEKDKYDFIVCNNYSYKTELAAIFKMISKKIPYYLELDGIVPHKDNFLKRIVKKRIIGKAEGCFSPCQVVDNYLQSYGVARHNIYRYNFTSLFRKDILENNISEEEKKSIRAKLNMNEQYIILAVGRFIQLKGFDLLLNAAAGISKNIGFYIVGGKPTEEYLDIVQSNNLEKNVHFIDFLEDDALAEYYKAADLFVHPTRYDVWGLVVNEAMAKGLPVITTTKCCAGRTLVNDENGKLISTDSVEELQQAITQVLFERDLDQLSKCSLNKIKDYSIEQMAEVHAKIFKKIIEQKQTC